MDRRVGRTRRWSRLAPMRITALAGGVGGARFLRGLKAHLDVVAPESELTVIANTGDDISLFGQIGRAHV